MGDGNREQMIREAVNNAEARAPRLQPTYFADIGFYDDGGGLVDRLLQRAGLSVIYGPTGCRKTFLALDIGMAIARHNPWRDRDTEGGSVVYIAAEAGMSFANRVFAYKLHHGLEDANLPFAAITATVDLRNPQADVSEVLAIMEQVKIRTETPVAAIFVDTLSAASAGGDEGAEDMGALVGNLLRIRSETDAHVCGIHHSGKDVSKGARGSSILPAAADTMIEVAADPVSPFSVATVRKQRDLPTDGSLAFGLTVVEVGTSRNGKTVTSCVVDHLDTAAMPKRTHLTPRQRKALGVLNNALADYGKPAPDTVHYPAGATVVAVDLWRRCLFSAGTLDKDAANPREDFRRLRTGLAERDAIAEWNGMIWAVTSNQGQEQ